MHFANAAILRYAVVIVSLMGFQWTSADAASQTVGPSSQTAKKEKLAEKQLQLRDQWRKAMQVVLPNKKGCFRTSYPSKLWKEVPCGKAPTNPFLPRREPFRAIVGAGHDDSAQAPAGATISTATGSFANVTGVTIEKEPISDTRDDYSLQLNTNFFRSPMDCAGSPNPNCQAWEQFVYFNTGTSGVLYIQYWLIKYNTSCPPNGDWIPFVFSNDTDIYCWKNSVQAMMVPNQPIANLSRLSVTGTVGETTDQAILTIGNELYVIQSATAVHALGNWHIAEFNIFGPGDSTEAQFNVGAHLRPLIFVDYGRALAAVCSSEGFTGETNNLTFGPEPYTASTEELTFGESSSGRLLACAKTTFDCAATADLIQSLQKQITEAQARLDTPECEGAALFECTQALARLKQDLSTETRFYQQSCRT